MFRPGHAIVCAIALAACGDAEPPGPPPPHRSVQSSDDPQALLGPDLPGRRVPPAAEEPAATLGADLPGRASPLTPASPWTITQEGVGTLTVGAKLHEPARGFEGSYVAQFYADAQPLEGFALDDPPALAVVSGGPFASWGKTHPGGTPSAKMRARAAQLARKGELRVSMIVITDTRPKTEVGIGVGDDYLSFEKRYPRAPRPTASPALWEEPSCLIAQGSLHFFFDRCDTRAHAKLVRIVVRAPEPEKPKAAPKAPKAERDTPF